MPERANSYSTRGDLAREQLRGRGLLFSGDVEQLIKSRLEQLPHEARAAFALACAERLMRQHEERVPAERRAFTLGWRPILKMMWSELSSPNPEFARQVAGALDRFYASPYNHDAGPDGPDDADDDAAAASIYAAECYRDGTVIPACWASSRLLDATFSTVDDQLGLDPNNFVWSPDAEPMPQAKIEMHPIYQAELRRQLAELALIAREGINAITLRQLHGGP